MRHVYTILLGIADKWKFGPVWDFGNAYDRHLEQWIYDGPTWPQASLPHGTSAIHNRTTYDVQKCSLTGVSISNATGVHTPSRANNYDCILPFWQSHIKWRIVCSLVSEAFTAQNKNTN